MNHSSFRDGMKLEKAVKIADFDGENFSETFLTDLTIKDT